MYERLLKARLATATRSALVLGPRQTGKSTLLSDLRPDWTLNLASPSQYRDYVGHPERLEHELRAAPSSTRTIFIDEIQRIPSLFDAIQSLLDEYPKRFRFLLSGSSARKLRRGQANLLPGRVHVHALHPLLERELGADFDLDRALAHGTLPGIYAEPDPVQRAGDLRSYAETYLREEVQAEALVRDVGGYSRLLDFVAAASGRILNLNALCQDAGLNYETARRYWSVLEDTLIVFRVPAWSGSDRSRLVAHPKIYLFDLGVRNALLQRPLDRPLEDERGLLFESFVAQELYRRMGTPWPEAKLSHFRTRHGNEVDFVLEVGREVWALQVKASRDLPAGAGRGIDAFAERCRRLKRRLVIFLGDRPQRHGSLEALPIRDFLAELPA